MGIRTNRVMKEFPAVRELFYGDGITCKNIKKCTFQTYLLDNKANESVLDEIISSQGIKLMIAPTGAGKSFSLVERARMLTAQDKDCKVIIALPSRLLTLQVGNNSGVFKMVGGDALDADSQIIATTYEKMFEIEDYILKQRALKKKEKIYLALDECHLLTTQHLFRKTAIKGMIRCIEKKLFDSVLLITATPSPMSLFHCNEIVEFENQNKAPAIDKIEILLVDDVMEYIKSLDYGKEFPFIRLNSENRIEELKNEMKQNMVRITSKDKRKKEYLDIVNDSKIDCTGIDGILCTSVIEAGVSITDYPDNIVPMAVFPDNHISADDIEQFLNRIRRKGSKHTKCARVVMNRPKEKELRASLVTAKGELVCEFKNLTLKMGNFYINDVSQMDSVADGAYKLKIEIGGGVIYRNLAVASIGGTDLTRYSKEDSMPLMYQNLGFRPFIHILKTNYRRISCFKDTLQDYVDAFEEKRQRRKMVEGLSDRDIEFLEVEDDVLIEKMTKGAIKEMGELEECVSYENGEIVLDKRILYMTSYNQYQRQFYYNHELLRRELEVRMGIPVAIKEESTAKGVHMSYNVNDIWEDIEDVRVGIDCNNSYWEAVMGCGSYYTRFPKSRQQIYRVREQEHLLELLEELQKSGITGGLALQILTSSKSKGKVTRYRNTHQMIIRNQMLNKFDGEDVKEILLYNKNQEEKIQSAIYCYLEQKCKGSYKITNDLAEEIQHFFKEAYPFSSKIPTVKVIKGRLKQMYKAKGKDTIKKELRIDTAEIFKLVKADY